MTIAITALIPNPDAIPDACALPAPVTQDTSLVDGRLEPWTGETTPVLSPIHVMQDGAPRPYVIGSCPVQDEAAAAAAVDAAWRAWDHGRGHWPTLSLGGRIRCVERFAQRMSEKRDEVSRLLMWEVGKSLAESYVEFDRTMEYVCDTVDAVKELDRTSSRFAIEKGIYAQIRRAPLGPALCMGPFNYPLNETFCTLLPALIMGNPAIVKTPRQGKLLFGPLLEPLRDCFPAGVVNVLYGTRRVVGPILQGGKINVLAFIGSSKAADALRRMHPHPHRLRCILGLDAKNAAIILPSADMELTGREVLQGTLAFNGQRCTALKIVFVHHSHADDLLARLCAGIDTLPMGMPWQEGVKITPVAEPDKPAYLTGLIEDAKAHGARVVNPGGGETAHGFFRPALLYPVTPAMRVFHEEQFGPVVPIVPFTDTAEPVEAIIHSTFGQQMSIFGTDADAVAELVDPMVNQVCRVNLNSLCQRGPDTFPFTGRKDSAEGTLSVGDALRCFSIRTLVAAKGTAENKALLTDILKHRRSSFLSTDFLL
ncbi:MAG: aldehyde dehydrogenase family protein [Desulfovibrionaceae bacterium]